MLKLITVSLPFYYNFSIFCPNTKVISTVDLLCPWPHCFPLVIPFGIFKFFVLIVSYWFGVTNKHCDFFIAWNFYLFTFYYICLLIPILKTSGIVFSSISLLTLYSLQRVLLIFHLRRQVIISRSLLLGDSPNTTPKSGICQIFLHRLILIHLNLLLSPIVVH